MGSETEMKETMTPPTPAAKKNLISPNLQTVFRLRKSSNVDKM